MNLIDLLLWVVFFLAGATAIVVLAYWLDVLQYDRWCREFESKGGIQWPVEVLDGSEVISHTVMREWRDQ